MAIPSGSGLARLLLIYSLCSEVLESRFTHLGLVFLASISGCAQTWTPDAATIRNVESISSRAIYPCNTSQGILP
jgi:hypothetical protein